MIFPLQADFLARYLSVHAQVENVLAMTEGVAVEGELMTRAGFAGLRLLEEEHALRVAHQGADGGWLRQVVVDGHRGAIHADGAACRSWGQMLNEFGEFTSKACPQ